MKLNKAQIICLALIITAPLDVFALESVKFAIRELCQHIEGNLGGLLMVAAGVGGMISAAFGNMKALYSCIVTGIGAFTASSMLSLYFPAAYKECNGAGGANAKTAVIESDAGSAAVSRINEVKALSGFLGTNSSANTSSAASASSGDEDSDAELF